MTNLTLVSAGIQPLDIAKYILYRSYQDGELVSPLKLQKLVYFTYVRTLIKNKKRLFDEKIQAWPNGPVVPSLYHALKKYGSSPIPDEFIAIASEGDFHTFLSRFPQEILNTMDEAYKEYMTYTAFELVVASHTEDAWIQARKGLNPTDATHNTLSDDVILMQYGQT